MKKLLRILYIKYVLGQCKHICVWCKYKDTCFSEFNSYWEEENKC